MPKLPRITSKELIKALNKLGFVELRQKGSHLILVKQTDGVKIGCVVPIHSTDLATGTLRGILKQAQLTVEELINIL